MSVIPCALLFLRGAPASLTDLVLPCKLAQPVEATQQITSDIEIEFAHLDHHVIGESAGDAPITDSYSQPAIENDPGDYAAMKLSMIAKVMNRGVPHLQNEIMQVELFRLVKLWVCGVQRAPRLMDLFGSFEKIAKNTQRSDERRFEKGVTAILGIENASFHDGGHFFQALFDHIVRLRHSSPPVRKNCHLQQIIREGQSAA